MMFTPQFIEGLTFEENLSLYYSSYPYLISDYRYINMVIHIVGATAAIIEIIKKYQPNLEEQTF